eukprot:scaffold10457_cov106-Isochrysis_galbana.AAC.3
MAMPSSTALPDMSEPNVMNRNLVLASTYPAANEREATRRIRGTTDVGGSTGSAASMTYSPSPFGSEHRTRGRSGGARFSLHMLRAERHHRLQDSRRCKLYPCLRRAGQSISSQRSQLNLGRK